MSIKEEKSKIDITKYSPESKKEKLFRLIAIIVIILFPLVLIACFRVVKQYKRAVVLRFGRVRKDSPAGPGIIWVIPCTDDVQMIDLRTQSFNLTPQEVLTKDSVTVTVVAVIYFHIENPLACLLNIQNNKYGTELITIATIRNLLGGHTLYTLLTSRESISFSCRTEIDKTTVRWGVVIERVEIKDVFLPSELQRAMAAEAEGTRIAKAKVIEAESEIQAAENLRVASQIMMEDPNIMRIDMSVSTKISISNIPVSKSEELKNKDRESKEESNLPKNIPHTIYPGFNLDQIIQTEGHDTFIEKCLVYLSYLIVIVTFPLSLFIIFVVVRQFERAIILRNGKLRSSTPIGPGLIQYLPCVDILKFTDLRIICYAVPMQEALTKDALTVAADAVVYYKIYDPIWAVVNIANYKIATQYLAATTLRNALGTRKLTDILCDRSAVSNQVFENMIKLTMNWGVKIVGFEIRDIRMPTQLQRVMATEAESYRMANAKIIVAKAEIECTRNLQKATNILMENPYCMQLRSLQALQMIAGSRTHTVVMPFSTEILQKLINQVNK